MNDKDVNARMQRAVDATVQTHAGSGDVEGAVVALKQAMRAQGITPQTGPEAEAELSRVAGRIAALQVPDKQ